MIFSTLEFIFIFLPLFLGIYYITPGRFRNWPLLLGSIGFYLYGTWKKPWVILLLFALTGVTFFIGRLLKGEKKSRGLMVGLGLGFIFASLLFAKYAGFFSKVNLVLPLGMSFYSFQLAAYLMDVYHREYVPEQSFWKLLTGTIMFPKLISGPLTPYSSLGQELNKRKVSWKRFDSGLRDFILGFAMKVLLADQIGRVWSQIGTIGFSDISTPLAWLGLASFSLQLYFDFFGYSTMAVGLGQMIGFQIPQNFNVPYTSRSMSEFWRRWHMTLGKWFLKYVYIPLGGSRNGEKHTIRNLFIVWLLTGIWHGATVNFILWSMFIFVVISVEKLWLGKYLEKSRIWPHFYFIVVVMISWMFFAITDLSQIGVYLLRLFPFFGGGIGAVSDVLRLGKEFGLVILIGVLASTAPFMRWQKKLRLTPIGTILLFLLFWVSCYYLSTGLHDPFMYFKF